MHIAFPSLFRITNLRQRIQIELFYKYILQPFIHSFSGFSKSQYHNPSKGPSLNKIEDAFVGFD